MMGRGAMGGDCDARDQSWTSRMGEFCRVVQQTPG